MNGRKVVFLDRDDTLIEDKVYLNDPKQIFYLPEVFESLKLLQDGGYELYVVTNQSGVPRGLVTHENIAEIHNVIHQDFAQRDVEILGFAYAPHLPDSDHYLRKPNPGMLLEAAKEHNIDLKQSWMVGDRMTDVEAGHRAGGRSILYGNKETPEGSPFSPPEAHVQSLLEMARFILKN